MFAETFLMQKALMKNKCLVKTESDCLAELNKYQVATFHNHCSQTYIKMHKKGLRVKSV